MVHAGLKRNGDQRNTSRLQSRRYRGKCGTWIWNVFQDFCADDDICNVFWEFDNVARDVMPRGRPIAAGGLKAWVGTTPGVLTKVMCQIVKSSILDLASEWHIASSYI
jgi:hypothetical protein